MKLGILRRSYAAHGGGERFLATWLGVLAEAGYDVHLFTHRWPPAVGVTVHRVPLVRGGSTLGLLSYALMAPRVARGSGVDLIHSFERTVTQDVYRAGEGCHRQWLELRGRTGRPALSALGRLRPFHCAVLALERRLCRGGGALAIAVNSRLVESGFARWYAPLRPTLALIENAVDTDRFHPDVRRRLRSAARADVGAGADGLTFLSVGSGFERKGLATTIRALGRLERIAGVRALLLVAGRGRPQRYRRLARLEGVEDRVRFVGTVDDPRPLYAAADAFVLPTVYDPASNATLEALAMGLAVITTRANGSAELIEHGKSGWLLERPDDADTLAAWLREAADPDRRRAVGEAGRAAVAPFTWERHLAATRALYARLGR